MGIALTAMSEQEFARGVAARSPEPLSAAVVRALYAHYLELVRWNERLGLIGRGTADQVLDRHYGESLAALPLIGPAVRQAVDAGSGGGFPGLVVAAARPELRMTLLEAREKKWSFLASAARKAALPCQPLNVRVSSPLPVGLPGSIDLVTVRALKLDVDVLRAFAQRMSPQGSILLWAGDEVPELPRQLLLHASVRLPGGDRRRILQLRPVHPATREPEPV